MRHKLVIFAALALIAIAGVSTKIDDHAMQIHHDATERAIGAFAIAKGLNAVISLIQGTEFSATPAGVGLTFSIGEVLDPINDMVERFSWIMLAATVSLGLQELLVAFGELYFIQFALALTAALLAALLWRRTLPRTPALQLAARLFVILLLLRFAAIGFIAFEAGLYDVLLQERYEKATQTLLQTQKKLDAVAHTSTHPADDSFWGMINRSYDATKELLNIDARLNALDAQLQHANRELINLATLFVLQSILLPLLFFWLLLHGIRWSLGPRFPEIKIWIRPCYGNDREEAMQK